MVLLRFWRRDHVADTQLRREFGTRATLLAVFKSAIRTH
jgi:hypothetical protein